MAKRARDEADWQEIAEIGARLRQSRLEAGITQVGMAERLNASQPDISNWERGVHLPDPRVIAKWAEETRADLRELLVRSRCLTGLRNWPGPAQRSFPEPPTLEIAASA